MIYANVHTLSSGRTCLSINTVGDENHTNLTLFGVTPELIRSWADKLEAALKEKEVADRIRAEVALSLP